MKFIITGGSGFIGTNLIEYLKGKNHEIKNIDIEEPAKKSHIKYWEKIDILDSANLFKTVISFQPEVVIHLAAVTDINSDDLEHYETNFIGTKNLINAFSFCQNLKRAIFTSTQYVCKLGYLPVHDRDYCPHTTYGKSKVLMEDIIHEQTNTPYEWIIIRPTSIWGPWFKYPYRKFFDIIYRGMYFDMAKTSTKTYGYVKNSVFQIERLVYAEGVHQKTFYIGDLPPYNISEWANEINNQLKKRKFIVAPMFFMRSLALCGDLLKKANIYFPMNSFRLKNMTSDNVMPLEDLYKFVGEPPYSRLQGTIETIEWLKTTDERWKKNENSH